MTATCTCCGDTFESDVPQEIGEEICNECYKAVFIDPVIEEDDDSPLRFTGDIYDMEKYTIGFDDLTEEIGGE